MGGSQPTPTRTGPAGETGCGRASFQLRGRTTPDRVRTTRGYLLLRKLTLIAALVVVLAVALAALQLLRPLPRLELVAVGASAVTVPGAAPALPWPTTGEADVAVAGIGTVGSSGGDQPEAIGSLAKIMTALLVLKARPLGPGASGPTLTITSQDVATYQADLAGGQSVVAVAAGEQLSELQLLQSLLLPSGNNIATLLADWDAGSQGAFVADMNHMAAQLGLGHTHYADASGLSPATVSDAQDQTRLAEVAMANRPFAGIVAMPQVTLPVAGVAYNVNGLVTHDGIVGVKTGSTPQAGGCYVFSAERVVGGRPVTIIGAVLGQGGTSILTSALDAGEALINATSSALTDLIVVPTGGEVGRVASPWGGGVALQANRGIALVGWPGLVFHLRLASLRLGSTLRRGVKVGGLQVRVGATVVAREEISSPGAITGPSLRWRLTML